MGDRTTGCCRFNVNYRPLVIAALKDINAQSWHIDLIESAECLYGNEILEVTDEEANYGELPWLTKILDKLQIPYDSWWGYGSEFGEGNQKVRFINGERKEKIIYTENEGMTDVRHLLELANLEQMTIEKFRKILRKRLEETTFSEEPLENIKPDLKATKARLISLKLLR